MSCQRCNVRSPKASNTRVDVQRSVKRWQPVRRGRVRGEPEDEGKTLDTIVDDLEGAMSAMGITREAQDRYKSAVRFSFADVVHMDSSFARTSVVRNAMLWPLYLCDSRWRVCFRWSSRPRTTCGGTKTGCSLYANQQRSTHTWRTRLPDILQRMPLLQRWCVPGDG